MSNQCDINKIAYMILQTLLYLKPGDRRKKREILKLSQNYGKCHNYRDNRGKFSEVKT